MVWISPSGRFLPRLLSPNIDTWCFKRHQQHSWPQKYLIYIYTAFSIFHIQNFTKFTTEQLKCLLYCGHFDFVHVFFCQLFFLVAIASPCSFRCRWVMVSSAGYISGPDIASLGLRACLRFNVHWFEKWSFQTKQQDTGWSPPLDSMFKNISEKPARHRMVTPLLPFTFLATAAFFVTCFCCILIKTFFIDNRKWKLFCWKWKYIWRIV